MKSCIVFPVHPPKFSYGKKLIESYNKHYKNDEIFVVFSSKKEELDFNHFCGVSCSYKSIIISPTTKWPPSEKKILGVKYIFDHYDYEYIGVIDSESLFIKDIDFHEAFSNKYASKIFFCTSATSDIARDVIMSPVRFFDINDIQPLVSFLIRSFPYHWFNDIPIYQREDFYDFFEKLDMKNKIKYFNWYDFDYIIYSYFLILYKNFIFVALSGSDDIIKTSVMSFLEYQEKYRKEIFKSIFEEINPMWARYLEDYMDNVFLLFHLEQGCA